MSDSPNNKRPRGRPRSASQETAPNTVQALERGLVLLTALAKDGNATLNDLALSVGIPPSTAHRLLITLQNLGFVDYNVQLQEWAIGLEAFRVGSKYLERTNLVESSRLTLRKLMEDAGETANLGIADQGDVVFLSQVETHNPIRAFFRPGARSHIHSSGIGKALMANMSRPEIERILHKKGLPEFTPKTLTTANDLFKSLAEIRQRGWSLDDEERYMGMRCIASPIYNFHGDAIAAISVSGPTVRFPDMELAEIGARVRKAAGEVTELIGGKP